MTFINFAGRVLRNELRIMLKKMDKFWAKKKKRKIGDDVNTNTLKNNGTFKCFYLLVLLLITTLSMRDGIYLL